MAPQDIEENIGGLGGHGRERVPKVLTTPIGFDGSVRGG